MSRSVVDWPTAVRSELDLLTPDDVCQLLKVKLSWLYDQVERGTFPHVKLGRQLRFRPSHVDEYLSAERPVREPQASAVTRRRRRVSGRTS